ncbi:MAG: MFS transporter [Gammaproteobacteria bacterium]
MTIAFGARQPCDDSRAEMVGQVFPCAKRDKPWILATAILGSSLAFIESSVVNLALPAIQSNLGATSTNLQWVINAYLLVLGAFMLIGGALGDRYGLRRIFMAGAAIFGAAALACAFAPSLPILTIARLVQGLGGALLVPTSLALIAKHFDENERGRAIGTWAGASALTTALGPVIGGWLVDSWGWQAVFLLMAPFAALTLLIAWWRVPPSPASNKTRLDYVGALLLVGALGLLIYALANPGSMSRRLILLAIAAVLGVAFLWREYRFKAPMLPLGLFRSRAFSGTNLMTLLLYFALGGALYFLPFNLIQVHDYSALQAGAAFLPFTLILGFGSTFDGGLIRKFDARLILTVGPLFTALGFIALAIPGVHASFVTGFLPGIVIMSVGMTLSVAPLTTIVMSSVSDTQAGVASGVNNTAARLAGVLAVAILTAVAVAHFTPLLGTQLHQQNVPAIIATQLHAQASRLADLAPPPDISKPLAAAVKTAVANAYVNTFRVLVIICAILAALSGLIAWLTLGKRT